MMALALETGLSGGNCRRQRRYCCLRPSLPGMQRIQQPARETKLAFLSESAASAVNPVSACPPRHSAA